MAHDEIRRAEVIGLWEEGDVKLTQALLKEIDRQSLLRDRPERKWTVLEYIQEEVQRQGHDLGVWEDGGVRVIWMGNAWRFANQIAPGQLSLETIRLLGSTIEVDKNREGFRTVGVRVGDRACPPHEEVEVRLSDLLTKLHRQGMEPLDFYRELELIHPFLDGNGRLGKVVLNLLNGTLDSPIFPANDFWGYPLRNP